MPPAAASTDALVTRAQAGEESAFAELLDAHRAELRAVVRRMVGHPEDTDDVVQESSLYAWQELAGFSGEPSFGHWLCAIGVRQSVELLRGKKRWRPDAQVVYQSHCVQNADLAEEVVSTLADPAFQFSAAEHIAYCFSCVGRSLPPEDQAALVLGEVMGLGSREGAEALGTDEPAFRGHLADARRALEREFEGLCSLENEKGVCYQCKGLRNGTPPTRQGPEPPAIASLDARIAIVRSADLDTGASQLLHDLFWCRTDEIEEMELPSAEPGDGGEDDEDDEDA